MVEFPAYFLKGLYDYFVTTRTTLGSNLGEKNDWGKYLGLPHTGCGPEKNVARLLFHRVKCTVSRETNGTERES